MILVVAEHRDGTVNRATLETVAAAAVPQADEAHAVHAREKAQAPGEHVHVATMPPSDPDAP